MSDKCLYCNTYTLIDSEYRDDDTGEYVDAYAWIKDDRLILRIDSFNNGDAAKKMEKSNDQK